jgi:hypothetical protein
MSKKINIAFDEKTGKFAVDMSGYKGRDCEKDLRRLLENLRELGIDVNENDIEFKPPQIPENAKIKVKE